MKEQSNNGTNLNAAVVSDRGLSKKRPLNEDSFLSDPERRIFAVADGVGGAQAGEVASQTAMEVLDEAFRHIEPGADVEDLLEIAIQRANSSIHSMSREHPKLSMMATTIVALHLDGHVATIGHVGDSRLYRLTPDGKLHRETADHSVVEEEVRAGRMTPEQASNHPSRNVISRALGAEETVEVDLKTMEIEDGTCFLLCSDGITRHLPDPELRDLLTEGSDLNAICEEMKRRCYERGAEDNLTAVIVRVGDPAQLAATDDERTIVTERPQLQATMGDSPSAAQQGMSADELDSSLHDTVEVPSKVAAAAAAKSATSTAPSPLIPASRATESVATLAEAPRPPRRSAFKSFLRAITF
ncbi:MAG TPA: PP2C family serine/threonine-protein phosphatase, partial [Pyrinomonadaceae bacterium]|nr:PP2C family serine/threonine-protein phosphatase [Pyrinomonadaceae bacterium]